MTTDMRPIMALATGQLGAFSRSQARTLGLSDHQLRSRIQSGIFQQSGTNVYRIAGAPRTLRSELFELMLDIGDPAWVTCESAAALAGNDGFELKHPFDVLLPTGRDVRRPNMQPQFSKEIPLIDRASIDGIPVTAPARTIIQLAKHHPDADLAAAIDSSIRDHILSEDLLHRRIVALRSQGRHGLPRLHEVLAGCEVTRGGHSYLERRYLELCAQDGLPRPNPQTTLSSAGDRLIRVDFRWENTPVVVELLGYAFHGPRQQGRDVARLNALIADGFKPYQFTYGQLVETPGWVMDTTRDALAPYLHLLPTTS